MQVKKKKTLTLEDGAEAALQLQLLKYKKHILFDKRNYFIH